ncbi:MAG: LD-carboxypeptidase [Flavobacteriaceae bacterium]|nr:LD-carboxypeptidase [Flavobacteriaceae bacterium]
MKWPQSLVPGSRIAIVAPAGRIYKHELEFALNWISVNSWEAVFSDELFREHNFGYFYAGKDEHRLKFVQQELNNPTIDAIWFARGGYGSVRLIDQLDFSQFIQKPKWIIGYSDITVFHNHLNNLGIPSLHAVTAKQLQLPYTPASYTELKRVLCGEKLNYTFPAGANDIEGQVEGTLVGGNLSMIYSQLGSSSSIQGENLILFIEDWQENWYHLDRMLMALKRSGLLSRIKGLIVGSFTKMDLREENPHYHSDFDEVSNQIILSFFENEGIPVMFGFPAGHIGDNRAMVFGSDVILNVDDEFVNLQWK